MSDDNVPRVSSLSTLLPILIKSFDSDIFNSSYKGTNLLSPDLTNIKISQLNVKQKFWFSMLIREEPHSCSLRTCLKFPLSNSNRYSIISLLESIKLCIRLYIFKITESRGKATLLSHSDFFVPETANKPAKISFEESIVSSTPSISDLIAQNLYTKEPLSVAEILYLFRPLVTIILLWRFGKKSWVPWTIPFAMETISYYLKDAREKEDRIAHQLGHGILDLIERNRRFIFLYLYLIREPLFTSYIRPVLQLPIAMLEKIPYVGALLSSPVSQALDLLHETSYFHLNS
ncbi:hypothetical protein MDAP_000366 [Mitosporidium daphniae]